MSGISRESRFCAAIGQFDIALAEIALHQEVLLIRIAASFNTKAKDRVPGLCSFHELFRAA